MALGDFTAAEAVVCKEALEELFKAIPASRRGGYLAHLNEILVFIEAAKRKMPQGGGA